MLSLNLNNNKIGNCLITADARTGWTEVIKHLVNSRTKEQIHSELTDPQNEENGKEDDVSQRQRRQVVIRTTQFRLVGQQKYDDILQIAQYSNDNDQTQVVSVEPIENFECHWYVVADLDPPRQRPATVCIVTHNWSCVKE